MPSTFDEFYAGLLEYARQVAEDDEPLLRAANYLIDHFPEEPPTHHESGNENRWDSEKQRRWYFWKVSTGQLENPYKRTHRLNNSFVTSEIQRDKNQTSLTVFSNYNNAVFVIGDANVTAEQAAVHEGRWWEFDAEVEKLSPEVLNELEKYLALNLTAFW